MLLPHGEDERGELEANVSDELGKEGLSSEDLADSVRLGAGLDSVGLAAIARGAGMEGGRKQQRLPGKPSSTCVLFKC